MRHVLFAGVALAASAGVAEADSANAGFSPSFDDLSDLSRAPLRAFETAEHEFLRVPEPGNDGYVPASAMLSLEPLHGGRGEVWTFSTPELALGGGFSLQAAEIRVRHPVPDAHSPYQPGRAYALQLVYRF